MSYRQTTRCLYQSTRHTQSSLQNANSGDPPATNNRRADFVDQLVRCQCFCRRSIPANLIIDLSTLHSTAPTTNVMRAGFGLDTRLAELRRETRHSLERQDDVHVNWHRAFNVRHQGFIQSASTVKLEQLWAMQGPSIHLFRIHAARTSRRTKLS